jgi:hypothetical protein
LGKVPNMVLHSDPLSYFNDTTPEAKILVEQLKDFNDYRTQFLYAKI